jgi:hypothetical protein
MTLMTAMTMNCRGSLNGVRHSAVESRDRAMGPKQWERKCDKARRCSRPARPLGASIAQPLIEVLGEALSAVSVQYARGYFEHAGYCPQAQLL